MRRSKCIAPVETGFFFPDDVWDIIRSYVGREPRKTLRPVRFRMLNNVACNVYLIVFMIVYRREIIQMAQAM